MFLNLNRYGARRAGMQWAVGLSLLGAMVFRRLMDKRAAEVRQAIRQAGQGNLHFRIPMNRKSDEFSLLEQDINQMLEQLEQLVHGIRHVSHMVAHNLRTPLNRALHRVQAAKLAPESLRADFEAATSTDSTPVPQTPAGTDLFGDAERIRISGE